MNLPDLIPVFLIDLRFHAVRILDRIRIIFHTALPAVKICFQRGQIVGIHGGKHIRHHLHHMDVPAFILRAAPLIAHHDRREIKTRALDLQRVFGQGLLLHLFDVIIHARGKGQDQRDADDADGSGESGQERPRLLRAQIIETERQRREERHGRLPHIPVLRLFRHRFIQDQFIAVGNDLSVF